MTDKTGGPAFPGFDYIDQYGKKNPEGMTLRDYFAAKAMQALLGYEESTLENDAQVSYMMADAMLKAREQ
jgi:hypothetical protein